MPTTNDDKFTILNNIRLNLDISKGNEFFKSLSIQKKPITDSQINIAKKILSGNTKFKKLLKIIKEFRNFDEAYKSYEEKSNLFITTRGRGKIKPLDMVYYSIISNKDSFDFLKKITNDVKSCTEEIKGMSIKIDIKNLYKKDKKLANEVAEVLGYEIKSAGIEKGDLVKVNLKEAKKSINMPATLKLLHKIVRNSGGKPVVVSINGDSADIAESEMAGVMVGTVRVPIKVLKKIESSTNEIVSNIKWVYNKDKELALEIAEVLGYDIKVKVNCINDIKELYKKNRELALKVAEALNYEIKTNKVEAKSNKELIDQIAKNVVHDLQGKEEFKDMTTKQVNDMIKKISDNISKTVQKAIEKSV